MLNKYSTKNQNKIFLLALAFFTFILTYRYYGRDMSSFNTTLYSFHYKYGFISRGFLGSAWRGLNKILPIDLMNFHAIFRFNQIVTVFYILMFFVFYYVCLSYTKKEYLHNMRYLIIFINMFAIPLFLTRCNFGRIDIFLFMMTILCLIFLITEKFEWLIIPICVLAECFHHGFIFMNINIILVLLFYKALNKVGKERKKYVILFLVTLVVASSFFLYFELFSHAKGEDIYNEVVAVASSLSNNGKYSKELVNHEILGQGVFMDEWRYHVANYIDAPIFIAFFWPYLVIAFHFFKNLISGKYLLKKVSYIVVVLGVLTVVPEMILKVDYGRYVFAVFFYYVATVMCLIAMGDEMVADQLEITKCCIKRHVPFAIFLLVYPIMFTPLYDIIISIPDDQLRIELFHQEPFSKY